MIYSVYVFHRNRCIFIAQYSQRGANVPPGSSDPDGLTAAAAAQQQQQQQRGSTGARGSAARGAGAAATAAAQQASAFPHNVSLQRSPAGSSLAAAAAGPLAAAAAAGAPHIGSNGARGSSSDPLVPGGPWGPLTKRQQQTGRLLAGLLYSMRRFCEQVGPSVSSSSSSSSSSNSSSFSSFATPHYKLHYLETATGYGFACLSSPEVPYMSEALQFIYSSLFLELVIKSPSFSPSKQIDSPVFAEQLHLFLSSLPAWES
ncbi:Trafficking protein particle complex subunit 1, related [Eimeria necatrix]|uniref:Trafficking protein particle complex subunit n=1 Tax=Eimeria necatrix TaxID=51315 RepID=U6MT81_9EIME|nr:Trafficking protein particle complex subunit 1, related [Eimeria necatrix]CDJ66298.1 Trafficking protein particle complex subunit 1, related [Eimeria necatrix]